MTLLTAKHMENDIISKIKAADQAKKKALRGLHKELGYPTAQSLADAILEAAEAAASTESKPRASATPSTKAPSGAGKRPRISEETKQGIADALTAGEPGNQLTKKFGVSYGIIHEIKTRLGLVKKKKASKKKR